MNLEQAEKFLGRYFIRDLHSKAKVPFRFKKNQKKLTEAAQKQQEQGRPIRIIVDKARRTGCSSWAEGMFFCHQLANANSHALIAAHEHKSSEALFSVPKDFAKQTPFLNLRVIEKKIFFPHKQGDSILQIVTAGKDTSGRGFTLSALHLSESAHYKNPDIYSSIIPAVSNHKDTMVIIESTPKGMEGDGEAFYEMWMDAIEERSEYEAVFLSWLDDEQCVADPEIAADAPADDEEKELVKLGVTKEQLAWRRLKISSPECGGLVELFHQEYPTTWQESFVTSGFKAFEEAERSWANSKVTEPKWRGFIERTADGTLKLREHHRGDLLIWKDPQRGHYYYIGADAARGDENREGRDFAANVCFDGNTGEQCFRYCGYVVPEYHACFLNSLGLHYNQAMVNGEVTGGYGYGTLYVMRDVLKYPNLYRWRGKHDELAGASTWRKSAWFETTQYTRTMLFESFRLGLREAAATDGDYGVTIYDEMLAHQVTIATRVETGRIEVRKEHDDVLFAAMLANIAMRQWAAPRDVNSSRSPRDEEEREALAVMRKRGEEIMDEAALSLRKHHDKIVNYNERYPQVEEMEEAAP